MSFASCADETLPVRRGRYLLWMIWQQLFFVVSDERLRYDGVTGSPSAMVQ